MLKLVADRESLLPAAQTAAMRLAGSNYPIPILQHFRLTAGTELTIEANDLDASISATCAADISRPGVICLPGEQLVAWLRATPTGSHIEMEANDQSCVLQTGRSRLTLPLWPAADFPDMTEPTGIGIELTGDDIAELFRRPKIAMSTETTRAYLNGIHLEPDGDHLIATATDGHQLISRSITAKTGAPGVIVPRPVVDQIAKLGADGATLRWDSVRFELETSSVILRSALINGTFPDYRRIIPEMKGEALVVERQPLISAIERLMATVSGSANLDLDWSGGALTLSIDAAYIDGAKRQAIRVGSGTETLSCTGEKGGFAVNPRYLRDVLNAMSLKDGTDSTVHIFADSINPCRLHDPDMPDLTVVVTPMRRRQSSRAAA